MSVVAEQLAHEVGARVRFHRLAAKKTQPVVAGLAGITVDYLYQIERGKKVPTLQVVLALARALGIHASALIDETCQEATSPARGSLGNDLHRAMMLPTSTTEPMPLCDLRKQINTAWKTWQTSPMRYSKISALLGPLIAEVENVLRAGSETTGRADEYQAAADMYALVRTVAKRTGRVDLAFVAADRERYAAEASEDALRIGVGNWNLAHVALAGCDYGVAEDIAISAADRLREQSGPDAAAVHGSLMLVAAMAAARRGDCWQARDRVRLIAPAAFKTGERNTLWTAFGPTNVAMHAVGIEAEAGELCEARRLADSVDYERSPSIERRVAFLVEQAHSHQQHRDYGSALVLLQRAEHEAPEDVAHRPLARKVLGTVIQRANRTTAYEAADLAAHVARR